MKPKIKARLQKLMTNIVDDFDYDKLSKSPARFNPEKLDWFNREYIKMMDLKEFALRANQCRINEKFPDKNLRVGDYAYFVDIPKQKIFMTRSTQNSKDRFFQDGSFYPIGGGRDDGETGIKSLAREVDEELESKVTIDPEKTILICSASGINPNIFNDKQRFDGKVMYFYFCPIFVESLDPCRVVDSVDTDFYEWFDLSEVLSTNTHLTYPIWQQFCHEQGLDCVEPNDIIIQQYLAWSLDKNRITVLSELGLESDCILRYQKPDKEQLKWKKSTLGESISNLSEIRTVVLNLVEKNRELQTKLYQEMKTWITQTSNPNLPDQYNELVSVYENDIKKWLSDNQKDSGSYLWPLRVALSGKAKSASLFELLSMLSPAEVENRLTQ